MKKISVFLVLCMGLAAGISFVLNLYVAGSNIRLASHDSEQRMKSAGAFLACEQLLDSLTRAGSGDTVLARAVRERLQRVARLTGLERITLMDASGTILSSSSGFFTPGELLTGYLIDTVLSAAALAGQTPVTTPLVKIAGVYFRSCYYPVFFGNEPCLLVIDADRLYYREIIDIRRNLILTGAIQFALFIIILASLLLLMHRHNRTLEEMRAQERLSFLGQTASELAHEIKNPLAILKASADVLRKKHDPAHQDMAFGFLATETMRLSRLIDNMLLFARERPLSLRPTQLLPVLDEIRNAALAEWEGVAMSVACPFPTLMLMADPDSLRQLFWNLLKNSVEAMQGKGAFNIRVLEKGKGLVLCLTDNGPGIPEKMLTEIFNPFHSTKPQGTGLGLAVVSAICEKHGWVIRARPSDKGACFEIQVPEASWQASS
ncbi:MAG: HAMP domain-containing sensor histidine kinase [Fibrobacterota bacterium]